MSKIAQTQSKARQYALEMKHLEASETLVKNMEALAGDLEGHFDWFHSFSKIAPDKQDLSVFDSRKASVLESFDGFKTKSQFVKAFLGVARRQDAAAEAVADNANEEEAEP
eukprot:12506291-Alexandrium_andersonii.AAC.1